MLDFSVCYFCEIVYGEFWDMNGKYILMAEDNPINAEITRQHLTELGFEIDHGENGKIALEKFMDSKEGHYAACVLDIMMPEMDGLETARKIRESTRTDKDIPIIAVTANSFAVHSQAVADSGINRCIVKPFSRNEFAASINELLKDNFDVSDNKEE